MDFGTQNIFSTLFYLEANSSGMPQIIIYFQSLHPLSVLIKPLFKWHVYGPSLGCKHTGMQQEKHAHTWFSRKVGHMLGTNQLKYIFFYFMLVYGSLLGEYMTD